MAMTKETLCYTSTFSQKKGDATKKPRREKSLGILSRRFIQLFFLGKGVLSLEAAAKNMELAAALAEQQQMHDAAMVEAARGQSGPCAASFEAYRSCRARGDERSCDHALFALLREFEGGAG